MAGAAPATAAASSPPAGRIGRTPSREGHRRWRGAGSTRGQRVRPIRRPPPSAPLAGPCRCRAPPRSRRPRRESAAPPVCAPPQLRGRHHASLGQVKDLTAAIAAQQAARRGARSAGACRSSARLPVGPILAGGEPVYLLRSARRVRRSAPRPHAGPSSSSRSPSTACRTASPGPCPPRRENPGGQVADEADRIAGEVAGAELFRDWTVTTLGHSHAPPGRGLPDPRTEETIHCVRPDCLVGSPRAGERSRPAFPPVACARRAHQITGRPSAR